MDMETREGNDVRMEDCETLLASMVTNCKRRVTDDDPSLTEQETEKAFAVGKTRVYFRSGGVEMLEKELAKTRNRCASIIQGTVRGFLVRTTVEGRQLNRRTRLGNLSGAFENCRPPPAYDIPVGTVLHCTAL